MFLTTTIPWWLPGAALILFGVAIILFPELLALMVASAFIFTGAAWLATAYGARKLRRDARRPMYVYRERTDWNIF